MFNTSCFIQVQSKKQTEVKIKVDMEHTAGPTKRKTVNQDSPYYIYPEKQLTDRGSKAGKVSLQSITEVR